MPPRKLCKCTQFRRFVVAGLDGGSEKVNNVVTCLSESELGLKLEFSLTFSVFQNRVVNNVMLYVGNRSVPGVYETTECKKLFKHIVPQHLFYVCVY
jgi:hypothetical protein